MERHPFTERHLFYSICALLIIGCVLRTAQYAGAVSLWHDELALALNFQKYEFFELLTQPLDHKQVAPAGFLAAVKASTNILGINEYGLRVWFFYTHSGNDKAQALKKHFESIGKQLYEVPDPFRNRGEQETAAYLYDLSTTR